MENKFSHALDFNSYFHCGSWYIQLKCKLLSGDKKYGHRKNKLSVLLDDLNMKKSCLNKLIPDFIFKCNDFVRSSFLAGIFDANGHIGFNSNKATVCHLTSESDLIINGIRKLLLMEGISSHISDDHRLYVWNTRKFKKLIEDKLILKQFSGSLNDGCTVGWVPRKELFVLQKKSKMSQRVFSKNNKISRQLFKKRQNPFVRANSVANLIDTGDVYYCRIASLKNVGVQQFYDISVEKIIILFAMELLLTIVTKNKLLKFLI